MTTSTPQADDHIAAAKLEMRLQFRKDWLGSVFVAVSFGGFGAAILFDPRSKIATLRSLDVRPMRLRLRRGAAPSSRPDPTRHPQALPPAAAKPCGSIRMRRG
jgi:hypothetical protein